MLSVALRHRLAGFTLDAAFEAPAGVTAIFGRSGAGKTTVVRAVAGLLRVDAGRVAVGDSVLLDRDRHIDLPAHRRRIGFVFQDGRLFPHLSVRQNLTYGRRFAPRDATPPDFGGVVEMLGIAHLLDRRPAGLSGGERGRVGIGRALLSGPRLLILDEPMAALDEQRRAEILPYLQRLRDEAGVPMLYITHAMAEVVRLANTLVLMEAGRVVRAGPVERLLADPGTAAGLDHPDAGAVLRARVVAREADGLARVAVNGAELLILSAGAQPGQSLRIRVPPQDVILSLARPERTSALNILPARVTELADRGPVCLVQ
ncbi:MAG TPA: molybdenum ABC transporter ATP-binding protein, partial [Paracoccus sp. (in: a-proteobacteria)]|nr:molybdenum ABC transporter ATP-binding protein [Paracoccus sp. (in: a-proteobacteria)]